MVTDGRKIAIGDVHGCGRELDRLLRELAVTDQDRLFFLGDLINRGPESRRVVQRVRELPGARWLIGNHEWRLLAYRRTGLADYIREQDRDTLAQLQADDWAFIEQGEPFIELPELNMVLVHGGFVPNRPWRTAEVETMVDLQVFDPASGAYGRLGRVPQGRFWLHDWQGPPFVVCGHTPATDVFATEWGCCLDTGCVYGGHLTAMDLEKRTWCQVKAYANYAGRPVPRQRPGQV